MASDSAVGDATATEPVANGGLVPTPTCPPAPRLSFVPALPIVLAPYRLSALSRKLLTGLLLAVASCIELAPRVLAQAPNDSAARSDRSAPSSQTARRDGVELADAGYLEREIARLEGTYGIFVLRSPADLERAFSAVPSTEAAPTLQTELARLVANATLQIEAIAAGVYAIRHDRSREAEIDQLLGRESERAPVYVPADPSFRPLSTDVLLTRDEPLYRAFDKIATVCDVTVVYHPEDIPRFLSTVRQAASVVGALRNAIGGTDLAYVKYAADTFVVAPSLQLTRAYADEVVAEWRGGNFRSPDNFLGELLSFRVGPEGATAPVGEQATVTGLVFDAGSGESLVGASVVDVATGRGSVVELDGGFALELPTGRRRVEIASVGYRPQPIDVDVYGDGSLPRVELTAGAASLAEVVVAARSEREVLQAATGGLRRLELRDIALLPAFSGDLDVLQALTRTAGVAATAEGSSAVSVRGGSLDGNLVLQGGIPMLYPAHALGFCPVFHPDLVGGVDLYRGYVPADLGGRAASVIDVGWRTGDFERWHLNGSAGLLASRLGVEGPLWKDKVSMVAGVRGSHLNWILAEQNPRDIRLSEVDFADASIGVTGRWNTGRLDLRGVYASDGFRYGQRFGFAYVNQGARAELRQRVGVDYNLQVSVTASAFTGEELGINDFPGRYTFSSGMQQQQLQLGVSRSLAEGLRAEVGALAERYGSADRTQTPDEGSPAAAFRFADPNLDAAIGYASATWEVSERWRLEGGLRALSAVSRRAAGVRTQYGGVPQPENIVTSEPVEAGDRFRHPVVLQPRLQVNYMPPAAGYTLGISYARLAQPIFQLSPTISPTPADIFFTASEYLPITTSQIVSASVASNGRPRRFQRVGYEFGVYYRRLRDGHLALGGQRLRATATPEQDVYTGDGFAAGAEASLRYEGLRSTFEMSYAFGRSVLEVDRRYEAVRPQPTEYVRTPTDLPHQIGLTYAYRPTGRFTLGAGWTFASGRPFTAAELLLPQAGSRVPIFSVINGRQLPPTHRLDLSFDVDNSGTRERGLRSGFGFSIYNVYQRENPYAAFFDRSDGLLRAFKFALIGDIIPSITIDFQWD